VMPRARTPTPRPGARHSPGTIPSHPGLRRHAGQPPEPRPTTLRTPLKNLRRVRTAVFLAQEVAARLGTGEILLRSLSWRRRSRGLKALTMHGFWAPVTRGDNGLSAGAWSALRSWHTHRDGDCTGNRQSHGNRNDNRNSHCNRNTNRNTNRNGNCNGNTNHNCESQRRAGEGQEKIRRVPMPVEVWRRRRLLLAFCGGRGWCAPCSHTETVDSRSH
jgi:hypothetical protein